MSTQVTVTLPDDTYHRAEYLARLTGREIADVLAETIDLSLQPLGVQHAADQPVAELSDTDVLAAADSEMDPAQEGHFRELLEKQQAGLPLPSLLEHPPTLGPGATRMSFAPFEWATSTDTPPRNDGS